MFRAIISRLTRRRRQIDTSEARTGPRYTNGPFEQMVMGEPAPDASASKTIPEDVMNKAREVAAEMFPTWRPAEIVFANIIARALMEERERSAKVARALNWEPKGPSKNAPVIKQITKDWGQEDRRRHPERRTAMTEISSAMIDEVTCIIKDVFEDARHEVGGTFAREIASAVLPLIRAEVLEEAAKMMEASAPFSEEQIAKAPAEDRLANSYAVRDSRNYRIAAASIRALAKEQR